MLWVPLALVLAAAAFDLRRREVPDGIALLLLAWAVVAITFHLHEVSWLSALAGLGIGLGATLVLYLLGGMGGGDVKLTAAVGAALGHAALPGFFLLAAFAGGALAIVAAFRQQKELAYVPAMALALLFLFLWQGGLGNVPAVP